MPSYKSAYTGPYAREDWVTPNSPFALRCHLSAPMVALQSRIYEVYLRSPHPYFLFTDAMCNCGVRVCFFLILAFKALFCSGHREPEMVDVVYKRCEYPGGCEKVGKDMTAGTYIYGRGIDSSIGGPKFGHPVLFFGG